MLEYILVHECDEELYQFHHNQKQYYQIDKTDLSFESLQRDLQTVPPHFEKAHHFCFEIKENHHIVGYIDYLEHYRYSLQHDQRYVWIGLFLVDEKCHRQGYGRDILHHFCQQWQSQYQYVQLGCIKQNKKGLAFWKAVGFYEIAEAKAGQNDCIVLELQLTS